jgi:hypothetical protein
MLTLYCLAGGLWMPEANALALLRRDIDRRPQRIKAALRNANIRKEFMEGVPDNDVKVVKRFVTQNLESALKTKPKVSSIFHIYAVMPMECYLVLLYWPREAPWTMYQALQAGLRPERRPREHGRVTRVHFGGERASLGCSVCMKGSIVMI